ncbi:hypothetical protein RI367_005826 [Sorochytrium milnesiophthora]
MILLAESAEDAQLMPLAAERQARDMRYVLNTNKCDQLVRPHAPTPARLLSGQSLPQRDTIRFLGMLFNANSAGTDANISRMTTKITGSLQVFSKLGIRRGGPLAQ